MHLVQERGVEERAVGDARPGTPGWAVDLEAPRQVGGQAEQLLVEPVAEAAEGLGEQQAGRHRVGERSRTGAGEAAADPGADRAADERAEDGDAALPDAQMLPGSKGSRFVPGPK